MSYLGAPDMKKQLEEIIHWYELRQDQGGGLGVDELMGELDGVMAHVRDQFQEMEICSRLSSQEPDDLEAIKLLRPEGDRRLVARLADIADFDDRLMGAMMGRFAGCTLGAAVELLEIDRMKGLAEIGGDEWPPMDYWQYVTNGDVLRYTKNRFIDYTRDRMCGVPVDDDIAYTLMGLMVVERFGPCFGTADVVAMWDELIPIAYTAEERALENYRAGVDVEKIGEVNNPYVEWIGAWIRSDGWGYMSAGWPEVAAEMAYRDAVVSHRRNGVYGEMMFSAAIAAAFTLDCPLRAIEIGLQEIPAKSRFADAIRWALSVADDVTDYQDARDRVEAQFKDMNIVHAINNACLVVFGIALGGLDITKAISQTVAMGMDNDCTAATVGSLIGAVVGKDGIPAHWTEPFGDTIQSYFNGIESFSIKDVHARFMTQAEKVWAYHQSS
ncbi:ADP-ribosylglycohydrolase [Poriferisphaera corsica]|uniref:ADP-ribosylglycohydrolase n=1 Tax=Poriferisphaera corsica TaxID=2528020 RepID=A0A517YV32_9BACT|nr:ADP-ribosylglycohydrolase family protein [Poriferisphaera corsica]QDU34012.1 ADP-ribosylglycohydrolase [Poriferisphaera corsica]